MRLLHGDCLEVMDELIAEGVKVDAIITDPPYGTTTCTWDNIIPFDEMWLRLNKLIKPTGAIVLFGSEPFSSLLRISNLENFKYDWIWEKQKAANFMGAKHQPLKYHEIISVFNVKGYKPQKYNVIEIEDVLKMSKTDLIKYHKNKEFDNFGVVDKRKNINNCMSNKELIGSDIIRVRNKDEGTRFPKSIIKINKEARNEHPTQKPVALMEYLIKTYTNKNELVLDFTMGSGSTGVACKNVARDFIGIELDRHYYRIARHRIRS